MSPSAPIAAPSPDYNHLLDRRILFVAVFAFFILNLSFAADAALAQDLAFVSVVPCRIADTRNADGPFGGPALAANATRNFVIPSSACNIPTTAAAYSLNFTVVPRTTLGYLSVWPTGVSQPLVSTLNSNDGRVKANAAIIPAGTAGAISVYATDETDLIVDISGYFVAVASNSSLAFFTLPPCRVADTRNADGALGGPFLSGGQVRAFPILASSCGVPAAAEAYSLNFTVVPRGGLGFLTVWPTGQTQPLVSTLNSNGGQVIANAAIVPAGTSGQISTYAADNTDLVIDINGYFAPASSGTNPLWLYNVTPCRVLDTRNTGQTLPLTAVVAGNCGVPTSAEAFVLNATVIPEGPLGYLTLWPDGTSMPVVSTLNADDGAVSSNMAIVPSSNGSIDAYSAGNTNLVLDVDGYFAAPATGTIQLQNSSSLTVADLYLAPGGTTNWGPNILPSPLSSGNESIGGVAPGSYTAKVLSTVSQVSLLPGLNNTCSVTYFGTTGTWTLAAGGTQLIVVPPEGWDSNLIIVNEDFFNYINGLYIWSGTCSTCTPSMWSTGCAYPCGPVPGFPLPGIPYQSYGGPWSVTAETPYTAYMTWTNGNWQVATFTLGSGTTGVVNGMQ